MPTKTTNEKRVLGFLGSFPKGINSYIDKSLLPPDQLSFAVNATMRGNYVVPRPALLTVPLTDNTGGLFSTGLFQGACYYRNSQGEYIMLAVNGLLFQLNITYSAQGLPIGALVTNIPVPKNLPPPSQSNNWQWAANGGVVGSNSLTAPIQWLWQSENFLIWQDGSSYPVFYDGTFTRRSLGQTPIALGTLIDGFTAPAQNQFAATTINNTLTPDLPINAAWTNGSGPVLVGTINPNGGGGQVALYNVFNYSNGNTSGYYTVVLQGITYASSDYINPGTSIYSSGQTVAQVSAVTDIFGNSIAQLPAPSAGSAITVALPSTACDYAQRHANFIAKPEGAYAFTSANPPYANLYVGKSIVVNGMNLVVSSIAGEPSTTLFSSVVCALADPPVSTNSISAGANTISVASDVVSYVLMVNGNFTLESGYAAPAMNGALSGVANPFIILKLTAPFTGNAGDILTIGTGVSMTKLQVSVIQSATALVCQVISLPSPNAVPVAGSLVTNTNTSASLTTLGTYPVNNTNSTPATKNPVVNISGTGVLSAPLLIQNGANLKVGQLVQVPVNGSTTAMDLFSVVSINSPNDSSTTYTIELQNINDTAGNTIAASSPIYSLPELPPGRMGCYGMGRNWVSLPDGVSYVASDLVGGATGTLAYNFTDAVLRVSQNYFLAGGGTFKISGSGEQICGMQFTAAIDASLGQGPLQVFTDDTVFSNVAPPDMTTWASLTSPIQLEGLIGSGGISQASIVQSNGDLLFRTADGQIQSMLLARLDFNQWGNTPVSKEIHRSIKGDSPALLPYASAVVFNNRALFTCQPSQAARGVVHARVAVLNFDPNSSMAGKSQSIWEGEWGPAVPFTAPVAPQTVNGLNVLQLVTGFFNGQRQCFALCLSDTTATASIQLVQINWDTDGQNDGSPQYQNTQVQWGFESPMLFDPEHSHLYKRLKDGEIYVDKITSNVTIQAYYRADQNPTWTLWYTRNINYSSLTSNPDNGFRPRVGLGQPSGLPMDTVNNRPMREGYEFQAKFVITGYCRFLGGRFAADVIPEPEFAIPV